jgi:uncharacterized membrane protein YhfC
MSGSVFTGVEILFFFLGIITTLLVGSLLYVKRKYSLNWKYISLVSFGIFLTIFCIAWSVSSVLEGEPQAANMGLIFFGLPAMIIYGFTYKKIKNIEEV